MKNLEDKTFDRTFEKRKIATEYVNRINRIAVCRECGAQPVEWHNPDHINKPNNRISSLRSQGASILRIMQEFSECIPLCRRHHMIEDGRLAKLMESSPQKLGKTYTEPSPCVCCGKIYKPLRNNMCSSCDNHKSGRRVRKTRSCDGCCGEGPLCKSL